MAADEQYSDKVRQAVREPEDFEPRAQRRGLQHEASSRMEKRHRNVAMCPRLAGADKQSQSGTGPGVALTTTPTNLHSRIDPQLFRVLLLRRLPLPFSRRFCRCVFLTPFGTIAQTAVCP